MKKGYIFIIITAFLYSTQEISSKFLAVSAKLDPMQVVFWVFLVGFFIFIPFMLKDKKKRGIKLHPKDFIFFLVAGTLCIPVSLVFMQTAVGYTRASLVAVIISANAVFTAPFAYFILKERIKSYMVAALAVTLIGVIFIVDPGSFISGISDARNMIGIAFAAGGAISFSLYSVVTAKRLSYFGGYVSNCFSFLCGLVVLFIIMLILDKPFFKGINYEAVLILLYMGVFVKALGYLFFLESIRHTSAITASIIFMIKPGLATLLAFLILGEPLTAMMFIGIAFIFIGSYISYYFKKKEALLLSSG